VTVTVLAKNCSATFIDSLGDIDPGVDKTHTKLVETGV
jgi:hypothetical protein